MIILTVPTDKPVKLVGRVDDNVSGLAFDPVYGRIYWTEPSARQSVLYTDSNANKLNNLYKNRDNARGIVSCVKTGYFPPSFRFLQPPHCPFNDFNI